jgi:hypothetical protein
LVVQTVHRHEHILDYPSKNEKHFLVYHEKCPICAFHFSIFTSAHKYLKIAVKEVYRRVVNSYKTVFVEKPYYLSLLLRGPPVTNDLVSKFVLNHWTILMNRNKNEENINNTNGVILLYS